MKNLMFLLLIILTFALPAFAADNLIGDGKSGSFQLIDNSGMRWNAGLAYTTNGDGDVVTIGGILASTDNVIGDLISGNHQLIDNNSKRWNVQVLYTTDGDGNVVPIPAGGSGGGSGTVTRVELAMPDIFSVSGSPVITHGTITATLASQAANSVFAGPLTVPGVPSFRQLVANDIPTITSAKVSDIDSAITNNSTVATNTAARHSHSNKTTLDLISEAFTTALKSTYDGYASTLSTLSSASHTHSNKSTLDSITEAFTTTLKSAYDGYATGKQNVQTRKPTAVSYAAQLTDNIIAVTDTSETRTITLPPNATDKVMLVIKDESGGATLNHIVVVTSGTDTIDGSASISIVVAYGVLRVYSNGSGGWFTI